MISLQTQQILVPKIVYIGDAAELRVSFNSSEPLTALGFKDELNFKDYTIQNVNLLPSGVNYYQLTVTFVPWKTGKLSFPAYELQGKEETYNLTFEPVNIVSIVEQNKITSLKDFQAPLLLPGTTYKLYGSLILLIAILILIIRLIIKRKSVVLFFKTQRLLYKYRKNRKQTAKKLNKLLELSKDECPDNLFAEQIQKIMRHYLDTRYAYPFSNCVTSQIMQSFYSITSGLLSPEKEEAAQDITGIFVRTDFIRYGQNVNSELKAEFLENERTELVENLIKNIEILEQEVKNV